MLLKNWSLLEEYKVPTDYFENWQIMEKNEAFILASPVMKGSLAKQIVDKEKWDRDISYFHRDTSS